MTARGKEKLRHQVCLPLNGRVQCIGYCIHHIVAALNAGGVGPLASCCAHDQLQGRIDLDDGQVLLIVDDSDTSVGWFLPGVTRTQFT